MTLGRNAKRTRERHARNFGAEADAVRGMECVVSAVRYPDAQIVPAHVLSIGASGGRFDIIPLRWDLHEDQHRMGVETFAAKHGIDMRAEADRVALEHARPLGIRGLADRYAPGRVVACEFAEFTPLETYECDALRGWLVRRMAEYVSACPSTGYGIWTADDGQHDMGGWIASDLGLDVDHDDDEASAAGQALCEWAGWPS